MSQTTSARRPFDLADQPLGWTGNRSEGAYVPAGTEGYAFAPAPKRDANRAAVLRSARRVQALNQCPTCFQTRSRSGACDC